MTTPSSTDHEGSDQQPAPFDYGHGRMPNFMKYIWLGFLAFGAFYVAYYLLDALASEVG